jgi:glucose/arabinose dehydrogenase
MTHLHYFLILFTLSTIPAISQITLEETTVDTTTVISGLDIPWEIQWGPDDHIWTTERFGRVSRINPETGEQTVILDISAQVTQSGESGLLGMVLHPDFEDSPFVYMAYTYSDGPDILERIVRYEYTGTILYDEVILLDNIRGSHNHDGCRLIISPDYKLFITTGDALVPNASQNINDLSGKVLRINLDGTIPSDNPYPGNPVWSIGHRNAQGLYLADNGILYSSEHGPSTDDELNIIEKGENYGWPEVHGYCDQSWEMDFCNANDVTEPLAAWTPTVAASDIILYDHPSIPEWQGSILMTTLKNKRIYELELDASGMNVTGQNQFFTNLWGRLRDICVGPDGAIYLATNGPSWSNTQPFTHKIIKVWNPDWLGLGKEENSIETEEYQIFPQPASDFITVNPVTNNGSYSISLFTLNGKLVFSEANLAGPRKFDLQGLKKGVYILQVTDLEGIFKRKVLIQ